MKIYIVLHGGFVKLATTDQKKAEEACQKEGGFYDDPVEHRFASDAFEDRTLHLYRSGITRRWNKSNFVIVEADLEVRP